MTFLHRSLPTDIFTNTYPAVLPAFSPFTLCILVTPLLSLSLSSQELEQSADGFATVAAYFGKSIIF